MSNTTAAFGEKVCYLSTSDLPLACPNPKMPVWNAHPRVYIDLSKGEASCPYCGTHYVLSTQAEK